MKYLLLAIPGIVTLGAPFYNHVEPRLAGFPLYFWFLLAMVPVTSLCIFGAYKLGAR
jgi:Protein of unknown function (DUF3311)